MQGDQMLLDPLQALEDCVESTAILGSMALNSQSVIQPVVGDLIWVQLATSDE